MSKVRLLFIGLIGPLAALGCNKSNADSGSSAPSSTLASSEKGGTSIVADDKGFTPSSVAIPVDKATPLTFTRTTDDTCAKEVIFPDLKISEPLPLNKAVTVTIPAGPARTLTFQCGMGMLKGKVVVH